MAQPLVLKPVTILAGQSLSAAIDLSGATMVGVIMPDDWDSALVTLMASVEGVNFFDVYNNNAPISLNATPKTIQSVNSDNVRCARWLKIRSGTVGQPISQTADRTFKLVTESGNLAATWRRGKKKTASKTKRRRSS